MMHFGNAENLPEDGRFYFRYESTSDKNGYWDPDYDEFRAYDGRKNARIYCVAFPVERETPQGVVIETGYKETRFICDKWKKKYAWRTRAEAKTSLLARRKREVAILEAKLERARFELEHVETEVSKAEGQ